MRKLRSFAVFAAQDDASRHSTLASSCVGSPASSSAGDSSEVVLARILGDASGAEDAGDMRVLDVAAQRNPPVNAKFHTADEKPADVRRIVTRWRPSMRCAPATTVTR